MIIFEYKQMTVRQGRGEWIYEMEGKTYCNLMSTLNGAGADGWELVMMNMGKYLFKRAVSEDRKSIADALKSIEQTVEDLSSHGDMPPDDAFDINNNIDAIRMALHIEVL